MHLNPLTLSFTGPDRDREGAFLEACRRDSLGQVRFAILFATALVALFGVQDSFLPRDQRLFNWGVRYLVLCPVSIALWAASFHARVARILPGLMASVLVLYGCGFVAMVLRVSGPVSHVYYTGLILLLMYGHTLLRLRFVLVSAAGLAVMAIYEVAVLGFTDTPTDVITNNSFFLAGATLIGMLASYALERSARRNHYLATMLADERAKVTAANQLLESRIQERTLELEEKNRALAREIADRERLEAERLALERHLLHAQKMESLGVLAGGIAHDFNNILLAIMGNAEMAKLRLPAEHPGQPFVERMLSGTGRARSLVQQILAFSRKQPTARKVMRTSAALEDVLGLVRASAPAHVEIQVELHPEPLFILADPTQIEQVLMNLVTNAFHAMEQGAGVLSLREQPANGRAEHHPQLPAGDYVAITVADTGLGMDADLQTRIFEPFFTTRSKGTGLGLSVAYGIVSAHGGSIRVESAPGRGSTFEILLPLTCAEAEPAEPELQLPAPPMKGRLLVVDDQDASLEILRMMLEEMGYPVTGFTNPLRARDAFLASPSAFEAVVSDLSMPGLTGLELASAVKASRPGTPFLLVTGFEDFGGAQELAEAGVGEVLPKPFRMADLSAAMARIQAPVG